MKNKNKVKPITGLRLYFGWFGLLTPVFGAGMLVGVGLLGALNSIFIVQIVVTSIINYFIGRHLLGRHLLKPVPLDKGKGKVKYGST